jgi:hypothetical protein
VHDVMIDKRTGQVEYAIMSFGGFGSARAIRCPGERRLRHQDGRLCRRYDRTRLDMAPRYTSSSLPDWSNRGYRSRIDEYWIPPV